MTQELKPTPCWYVKDYADGWIKFYDVDQAAYEAMKTGAIMRYSDDGSYPQTYTRPQSVSNSEALEALENVEAFIRVSRRNDNHDMDTHILLTGWLNTIRAALTPKAVDVDAVAKEMVKCVEGQIGQKMASAIAKHLASQGYITTPEHIEVMKQMREILAGVARDINLDCGTAYAIKSQCKQAIAAADALIGGLDE